MPPVPSNDLSRRIARHRPALDAAVQRTLDSGWFLLGPETTAFEEAWATYCGVSGCVAVANGTDALEIGLRALGCAPGDEVVVAANAGAYTTTALLAIGATPVYADVRDDTLLIDPESVARMVGPRTRAVVATHLYGNVVDVEALRRAAPGVPVVEDGAQAHGARWGEQRVGSLGDVAAFSFYPTKNLGALGDGGAVVSSSTEVLDRARLLRQYGWGDRYRIDVRGGRNSRMDELQAAMLRELLPALEEDNERRRAIVDRYRRALGDRLRFVADAPDATTVGHLCVVRSPERDGLVAALQRAGIGAAIHYPIPDHRQPALAPGDVRADALPHTERACAEVLSLPCFPELRDDEVERVIESFDEIDAAPPPEG